MTPMSTAPIIVGTDGSPGSLTAVGEAATLGKVTGAHVVVVHAYEAPGLSTGLRFASVPPNVLDEANERHRTATEELLTGEWTEPLRTAGVDFEIKVVEGNGPEALLTVAEETGASMIVVGARGHGGFANLLLGSVSSHLVHHAPVPVLVVPPPND